MLDEPKCSQDNFIPGTETGDRNARTSNKKETVRPIYPKAHLSNFPNQPSSRCLKTDRNAPQLLPLRLRHRNSRRHPDPTLLPSRLPLHQQPGHLGECQRRLRAPRRRVLRVFPNLADRFAVRATVGARRGVDRLRARRHPAGDQLALASLFLRG